MKLTDTILEELIALADTDTVNSHANIFGPDGVLDSMGLVNLVVALEERILEDFDVPITIADERAMSRTKSPFLNVENLAEYITELLREEGIHA